MVIVFKTETGSIYHYGTEGKVWERVDKTGESGFLRQDGGMVLNIPVIEVGKRVTFVGPPLKDGSTARVVLTSEVVKIISQE